ncbi:hypothetical protein DHEL01_v204614 [Diaporthe helianthi]|uniref:C2H2-type domain-containing protein n=1 Tax=Diaporthe helianthi TaxID=158607 RepID=A0A2P5I3B2_DIAHE|nr:hypothetical protein DHEL01_v204614 [Diaporthe helianthi]
MSRNRLQTDEDVEAFISQFRPNPDGPDYAVGGKLFDYRALLRHVREGDLPEDVERRAIDFLKEEAIPFAAHCEELKRREAEELKAVFVKYNGPEGIRNPDRQRADELRAKIPTLGLDSELITEVRRIFFNDRPSGNGHFWYEKGGWIKYHDLQREVPVEGSASSLVDPPSFNPVPLAVGEESQHHHNINPDDDLLLNGTLLELLQGLMKLKCAERFINFDHEKKVEQYQRAICRPRCLSFIEKGLKLDHSIGYGATAFFNDMLLVFTRPLKFDPWVITPDKDDADTLEKEMEKRLRKMGSVGEQLLVSQTSSCTIQVKLKLTSPKAKFEEIKEQGPEFWSDPEAIYFQAPFNPQYAKCNGTQPNIFEVKASAWDQLQFSRKRVQQLRARLASKASKTAKNDHAPATQAEAPLSHEPRVTLEKNAEPKQDGQAHGPEPQQSNHSANPGPSDRDAIPLVKTASKRPRQPAGDDQQKEQHPPAETRAAKRQRLADVVVAPSSLPATSPVASVPDSSAAPSQRPSSKRSRTPSDVDNDGDDQGEGGDSRGASSPKRRRLIRAATSAGGLPADNAEAGPSTAGEPTPHEAAADVPGSSQAQASSAASVQTAPPQQPQQPQQPAVSVAPSSQALPSSSNTVTMSKIAKMGKTRPWVFGYNTDEGYGLYAIFKCPRPNCKQRFSSHPLKNNHARDHFVSCGQPVVDEQDMVRQYASQVVKDAGRKSGLTVDWARNSNVILLPANEKNNHPDNFPLSPAGK